MNAAVAMVLYRRAKGQRHSDINWKAARQSFDYCNQPVDARALLNGAATVEWPFGYFVGGSVELHDGRWQFKPRK